MTTASAAAPEASNIRPRWRSGSWEVIRTALTLSTAASPSAPCDSADLALAASLTSTMNEIPSPSAIAGSACSRAVIVVGSVPTVRRRTASHSIDAARRRRPRVSRTRLAATAGARTITGTHGNDRLVGSPRADTIRGEAGRDLLLGRGGGDYLDGGPGRDTVDGGAGADQVVTAYDGGRDSVRCGAGADIVNADLTDAVARDCELIGRRLSRDPYRSTEPSTRRRSSRTASPSGGRPSRRSRSAASRPGRREHRLRGHERRRGDLAQRLSPRADRSERSRRARTSARAIRSSGTTRATARG
jgi:hypothetical protein